MVCSPVIRQRLVCDKCGALYDNGGTGYESPTEARAVAYAAGWRFPNRTSKGGKLLSRTWDVCPVCSS